MVKTRIEDQKSVVLKISDDISLLLEKRGILESEAMLVIDAAERSGVKLRDPEGVVFLAKARIADVTYFVQYRSLGGSDYEVMSAYSCKSRFEE
jgi:hypothetical protein